MSPGVLHVVVGLAHSPLGLVLTALGFTDIMHHICDSVVQFVQHMPGTLWKQNSIPSLKRRLVVARSRVVGSMFFRAVLFRTVLVRPVFFGAMFVRAMSIGTTFFGVAFFGAPVPARLCKLLWSPHHSLTSRVALVDAGGIRRVLVQRHERARRQDCAQRQYGIRSAHDLLALGERDPPQSAQRLRRSASAQRDYDPLAVQHPQSAARKRETQRHKVRRSAVKNEHQPLNSTTTQP